MLPRLAVLAAFLAAAASFAGATGASPGGGGRIAFASDRDGNGEIYAMQPDGSEAVNLTSNPSADQSPSWSPEADRIAFATFRDGRQALYLMNADGSDPTRLSPPDYGSTDDMEPAWSPDGSSIAFASTRPFNDTWSIWAIDADGTDLRRLTTQFSIAPAWSPDGTRIAYIGDGALHVMNADGSGAVRMTASALQEAAPAWSPDGTQIVFGRYRADWQQSNAHELFILELATGAERQLTSGGFFDGHPSWSPDGAQIVFQRHAGIFGAPQLFTIEAVGGAPQALTSGAANYTPAWGPPATEPPPPPGDTTPPTISIASPAEGATFALGTTEPIWFTCRDDQDGPDAIARCAGTVDGAPAPAGSTLPTGAPGSHTLTVSAVDASGNTATATRTYTVLFDFSGFDWPLNPYPELTSFRAGERIPLRFSLAGYAAGPLFSAFSSEQSCASPGDADLGEPATGALAYNRTHDRHTFTWQTEKRWAGTCRQVVLELTDGTRQRANVRFAR